MSTAFIRLSPARKLKLVVIYPGTGYGTQKYVLGRIEGILPADPQKVLIAVASSYGTPWATVVQEVHDYAAQEGLDLKPSALVGWSGGAQGIAGAVAAGHDFPKVLLADPSPVRKAFEGRDTRIWYNPENWKGSLAHLGPKQVTYASPLGNKAILVSTDHNTILDEVVGTAVKEARPTLTPALMVGVPATLLIVAFFFRRGRGR